MRDPMGAKAVSSSETSRVGRRRFAAGVVTLFGGGLLARAAEALPAATEGAFTAATRILRRFGISIGGAFDADLGHDVVGVATVALPDTQYDFAFSDLAGGGQIDPCWKSSSFDDATTFTHFSPDARGVSQPFLRAWCRDEEATVEKLDPDRSAIDPCWKATVRGEVTTFEVRVEAEGDGSVDVLVDDPGARFSVTIGTRTYRLVSGELVLDTTRS